MVVYIFTTSSINNNNNSLILYKTIGTISTRSVNYFIIQNKNKTNYTHYNITTIF